MGSQKRTAVVTPKSPPSTRYAALRVVSGTFKVVAVTTATVGTISAFAWAVGVAADADDLAGTFAAFGGFLLITFAVVIGAAFVAATGYLIDLALEVGDYLFQLVPTNA